MRTARRSMVAVLLVGALLAAGCSSDEGNGSDGEASGGEGSAENETGGPLTLTAASTRPEYITGGDVVVEVGGSEATIDGLTVAVDGDEVDVEWADDDGKITGLVTDLEEGDHTLTATVGEESAELEVVNHPTTGPLFSGPPLPLEACSTEAFGLGPAIDDDCSAAEIVVTWSYVDTAGERKPLDDPAAVPDDVQTLDGGEPFIIREEKGTLNRAVYWITVLDPTPNPDDPSVWDDSAWNGRLVYEYGGGCGVTYSQGFKLLGGPNLALLEQGYAHATATFNTFQVTCNPTLSAETTMVVKEHFGEAYAVPELTIGSGGSGGAIQQFMIAQNYPGLLDAISPMLPFPDAISISTDVLDCGLLERFYREGAGSTWTPDAKLTATGHLNAQTCTFWEQTFVPNVNPKTGCTLELLDAASGLIDGLEGGAPEGVDDSLAYDAETNPEGLRCTLQDGNRNQLGIDTETGFARRPWDNVGVQYGLTALNDGDLTLDEFLDLNEGIGSFDIDGNWTTDRAEADEDTIQNAYEVGAVNQGLGDLARIPIIEVNLWTDDQGDIHTRDRAFTARERTRLADGSLAPNHMLWTRGLPEGETLVDSLTGSVDLGLEVITVLDEWATALAESHGDEAGDDEITAALDATRPDAAIDNCVTADGQRISALDLYEQPGPCTDPYPVSSTPRRVAGAPLVHDILKCELIPVADATYELDFTDEQQARLEEIFPDGVCDWTEPGVGQVEMTETWRNYDD